ncbi:MAG: PH domain-containing protein [Bacteroidota bacterium]
MSDRSFPCKQDCFSGIVSFTVPGGAVVMMVLATVSPEESRLSLMAAAVLMLALSVGFLLLAPKGYLIQHDGIAVQRRVGLKKFPAKDALDIRRMDAADTKGLIRTFGNGGLFGYTGRYYSPAIGQQSWYCSRRTGLVVIRLKHGIPVVFSPDDPEAFVEAANEMIRTA